MLDNEEQKKDKPAFLSKPDMNYTILNQEAKYFPNAGFAVHFENLIELIEKDEIDNNNEILNDLTGDESEKMQYNTGIFSNIDVNILKSNLFKHISNYLYSKKDLFSEFGSIFLLAEKYTYDFYNYGVIEDDLEAISINDPILNGLSLFIEDFLSNKDIRSPNEMYQTYFNKPVDDLIKDGQEILDIKNNNELEYESLKFRMNNSMFVTYKFKAKLDFDNDLIINQFAKIMPDVQHKNTFENIMLNLLDRSILESPQDYRANLIKLINLKGFYYHLFILKIAQKFKENISIKHQKPKGKPSYNTKLKNKTNSTSKSIKPSKSYIPLLSTIYHLLNYFDEPYIKILDYIFISEEVFDETVEKFEKKLHLFMNE